MNQDLKKYNPKTNNLDSKLKSFAIFKIIMSIIYFIPAFFIFGLGMVLNLFLLIIGSGGSKVSDTSSFMGGIEYISFFTIIPTILAIVLFIITLIFTIKLFKNKYNKAMDLLTSILFIIINLFLITFLFKSSFYLFGILLSILSIIFILNIFYTTKVSNKKVVINI